MDDIEVINASFDHIDDILIVENLCFTIPWSKKSFIEEIEENKNARYFVAVCDKKVIGYCGVWIICDEGHITNIAVHPEYRKAGIGSKLLEALLKAANKEGVYELTLEVRKSNIAAQMLYQKFGFKVEGIRKRYYSDNNEDAFIMWKHQV